MDHQAVSTVRLPLETECLTGPGSAKQTDAHEAQVVRILDDLDEQINLCPIALWIRSTRSDSDERCLIGCVPRFSCRTEIELCK
jgi:hypothetical protein